MTAEKVIQLRIQQHTYPVLIGHGLFCRENFSPYIAGRQVLLVTNATLAGLYLEEIKESLADYRCDQIILPDGESHKNLANIEQIYHQLLRQQHGRDTTMIALGGGVVGDMAGFAAATYQRGVAFLQVPTTLLAQVDAAIGGKTGVNHPLGKNMIGAFHQPEAVLINLDSLVSLPEREFNAGMAEVIKAALLADQDFFAWLIAQQQRIKARDPQILRDMIAKACQIKAEIVMQDEKEKGVRALLNLGHTFGHAIETWLNYQTWLHGEAVATGIAIAACFSLQMQWLQAKEYQSILQLLQAFDLPVHVPDKMQVHDFLRLMQHDKKVHQGKLRFILLKGVGNAVICQQFPQGVLQQAIEQHSAKNAS